MAAASSSLKNMHHLVGVSICQRIPFLKTPKFIFRCREQVRQSLTAFGQSSRLRQRNSHRTQMEKRLGRSWPRPRRTPGDSVNY